MALSFDKTQFYETGMRVTTLSMTSNATIAFWAKRASTDVRSPLGMNNYTVSGNDKDVFAFFCNTGQLVWVRINTANTNNATVFSGAWGTDYIHLAATYDGSKLRSYINGVFEADVSATGNLLDRDTWVWGRRGNYVRSDWNWYGDLAEVSMWNVTLSASEIASLGKGFCASRIRPQSLKTHNRLIRTLADAKRISTASGTVTPSSHPRVY